MLFNFFKREKATAPAQAQAAPSPQVETTASKGATYASNTVAVNGPGGALSVAAFYRGVELRANTMSMLVMEYQKRNDRAHGGNYEMDSRADGGSLNYLLQVQPNPTMTWATLIKQAELLRIFAGNAVVYIERDIFTQRIVALWLCSSATYNIVSHTYSVAYNCPGGQRTLTNVDADDVLHIRNTFTSDYGLTGIPTLTYAKSALTLAATNDKLVTDTAGKGMRQKLLVQEDKQGTFGMGRANKKQLEKIADKLQEDIYDKDVVLLSNIASVTPISTNLQQQDISLIRSFSVREIARFLGTPASMLMDDSNSSYKTPEAATQEFLVRTIAPLGHDWEMELNAKLLGPSGYPSHRFHFNDDSLMRLDPTGRANLAKTMLETGVKCVNELRADYDLPAVEGGDRHFISTNLQPVDAPAVGQPTPEPNEPAPQEPAKKKTKTKKGGAE